MSTEEEFYPESDEDKIAYWKDQLFNSLDELKEQGLEYHVTEDGPIAITFNGALVLVGFSSEDAEDDEEFEEEEDDQDEVFLNEPNTYLIIQAPVIKLPKSDNLDFYKKLLLMNCGLASPARLSISSDLVLLDATLDIDFITDDMIVLGIVEVMQAAQSLAMDLIDEFGIDFFPEA